MEVYFVVFVVKLGSRKTNLHTAVIVRFKPFPQSVCLPSHFPSALDTRNLVFDLPHTLGNGPFRTLK